MRNRARMFAGVLVASGALASTAAAAPIHGTISAYKHHSNGYGTLVIHTTSGKNPYFIVSDKSTTCGLSQGQSGDALPGGCKNLAKYVGYQVDVVKKAGSKHSVSLVSVNDK